MNEKTIASKRVFDGRLLKIDLIEIELPSGGKSRREVVRHPGAIGIVAEDGDGRFLFVRQYRKPVEQVLLEIVAGTLDPGESPEECARRELKEETGRTAGELKKMGVIALAPGYSDERLHVYYAKLLHEREEASPDEDEKIEVVYLSRDKIEEMIENAAIGDAKTLAAWLLYTRQIGTHAI